MNTLHPVRLFALLPLLCAGVILFAGCDSKKVEDATDKAKEAAEGAKEAVGDATDAVGDAAKGASEAVGEAAEDAASAAGEAAEAVTEKVGDAAEGAAAAASDAAKEVTDAVSAGFSAAAEKASEALASVEGGGAMLTGLKDMFGSAMETLRGITDKATAEAALPKLDELNTKAEEMAESAAKLPEEALSAVGKVVESGIEGLKSLADKLLENAEISEVIKPKLDALMDNLKKMTGA